ncbi:MAG: hypothetical protein QME74_08415 [Candidatus Edwardsbacteria bacterium]|nr:hypothetical protein [Candidatus Edwardsbacteria bacterium]
MPDSENKNGSADKIMVIMPDGKVHEVGAKKISVITPDGRVQEAGIVLTIEDMRDKQKTVFKMHGGSPQMIMSAKESLMVDISDAIAKMIGDKVEVTGSYKTDMLVYYSPTAFSADKERAVTLVNKVYSQRLMALEKERREHLAAVARLKKLYEEERSKGAKLMNKVLEVQHSTLTDQQKQEMVAAAKEEAMKIAEDTIAAIEAEKQDLERTIAQFEQLLQDSIPITQHSEEMERLKSEYDAVNRRAMFYLPISELAAMPAVHQKILSPFLPKVKDDFGNDRLFDLASVLKLKAGQAGLREGSHALVKYKTAYKISYFLGRLFFNDTRDYVCLGQGVDITSGVYSIRRDQPESSARYDFADEEVLRFLAMNPLQAQIYLDAVKNSSIQTVQFWLHDLKADQSLEIQEIDALMDELMRQNAMMISHTRTYEQNETLVHALGRDGDAGSPATAADPVLDNIRRAVIQPISLRYITDEQDIKRQIALTADKQQQDIQVRQLKTLQKKKQADITTLVQNLKQLLLDEDMVGSTNVKRSRYGPQIEVRDKLGPAEAERIRRDPKLLESLLE